MLQYLRKCLLSIKNATRFSEGEELSSGKVIYLYYLYFSELYQKEKRAIVFKKEKKSGNMKNWFHCEDFPHLSQNIKAVYE